MSIDRKRPPASAPELVSRIALQGPVGTSLEEALEDLVGDCLKEHVENDKVPLWIDEVGAQRVFEAYGNAVASSSNDWDAAPSALLRGNMDHYNRIGGQWRIMAQDCQLLQRTTNLQQPSTTTTTTTKTDQSRNKRRRQRSPASKRSLWDKMLASDSAGETSPSTESAQAKVVALDGVLQVLAYDDL